MLLREESRILVGHNAGVSVVSFVGLDLPADSFKDGCVEGEEGGLHVAQVRGRNSVLTPPPRFICQTPAHDVQNPQWSYFRS
ncbi:hypothetical protein SAMN04487916_108163 [Arthrobacter sp. ov407]|nr:hypothetical protein SAMN04487916_108163 [Arthrobacter sp. ov407]